MIFDSILFLFRFLPVFLICYFVAPGRMKNVILFLGSLVFYAWGEPVYILLILFTTISDYVHGRLIDSFQGKKQATGLLISSITINLLVLGFFQYADWVFGMLNVLTGTDLPLFGLPIPIGIAVYALQTMSYTIDVYRGKISAQKNLLHFGVYVTMFPKLLSGPIVRYQQIETALHKRSVDVCQISYGMKRFVAGLAKKVLLANNIGALWNEISQMPYGELNLMTAWLGILAFAVQIYFEWSGYSDMAIGLGAVLGFSFPENFNYPYISATVTEFWRRWNITLGNWFKEYVYIPLGGSRLGIQKQLRNIIIVWGLIGIWHGADGSFLLWGLWFAVFLSLEKLFLGKLFTYLPKIFGWIYTFVVVMAGWVLFATETLEEGVTYFSALIGVNGAGLWDRYSLYLCSEYAIWFLIGGVACLPLVGNAAKKLAQVQTGPAIMVYRIGEKIIPAILLFLSIAYMI